MTPKLSDDLEQLVTQDATGIVKVDGANGSYFLMTEDAMRIRKYVQEGIDDIDRGNSAPWNVDEIIEKAEQLKEQRSA